MRRLFLTILLLSFSPALKCGLHANDLSRSITEHLSKKEWVQADKKLKIYIKENPGKNWAYSSHAWVLVYLKKYNESERISRQGLEKWPTDVKIKKALSHALYMQARNTTDARAVKLLQESVDIQAEAYKILYLAIAYRNLKNYEKSLEWLKRGQKMFPEYKNFRLTLAYTRSLHFKTILKSNQTERVKTYIENSLNWLDNTKTLQDQHHYLGIIKKGLRKINDRAYFEIIFKKLITKFEHDPRVYDEYGFSLYANFRVHNQPLQELKQEAINWRRKAYRKYWAKHTLPPPIIGLNAPLSGRHAVWSEFGGRAMTHNGFANYCYDFAAVDKNKNIYKPGTEGKKNENYYMFGQPVYAVEDGKVIAADENFPDNKPGGFSARANVISIDHGAYSSFYAHLKFKGLKVKTGHRVKRGQLIGYVGNSGMSSQAHLHFCIYRTKGERITIPFRFKKYKIRTKNDQIQISSRAYKEDEIVLFQ